MTQTTWCPRCCSNAHPIDGRPVTQVDIDGTLLDVNSNFCYLGDMLSIGGGCVAWVKFRKLLPVLTTRHRLPKVCSKVYSTCVRSAMLHGSETWEPNVSNLQRLRRNDRSKALDKTPSDQLLLKLGLTDITVVLHSRLRWFGHVQRAESCINMVTKLPIPGNRGKGRSKRIGLNVSRMTSVNDINPMDRVAWRNGLRRSLVLPTP